jgi:hypothetical protein
MDGSLAPVPTLHAGRTEAITVTPAFFADGGWLQSTAYPRLNGVCVCVCVVCVCG